MNLREETIKVLREITGNYDPGVDDEFEDRYETEVVVSMGIIRSARSLLSRLEAGSGEETGVRLDEAARETLAKAIDCLDLEGFEETANSLHALINRASQEGGDAAGPPAETAAVNRRNVATPAPGENSGRAEAQGGDLLNAILHAHQDYETASETDARRLARKALFAAKQALFEHIVHMNEIGFAAGRRSMREEAAKVADAEHNRDRDDDEWAAGSRAACVYLADAIRAIPEKQS